VLESFFATAALPGSNAVTVNAAAASNANWARRCGFFTSYLHDWMCPSEDLSPGCRNETHTMRNRRYGKYRAQSVSYYPWSFDLPGDRFRTVAECIRNVTTSATECGGPISARRILRLRAAIC